MRVGRAQEHRVCLSRQHHIVLIPSAPGQQPAVLEPPHRLADAELHRRREFLIHR
jgi:hypothetical protein